MLCVLIKHPTKFEDIPKFPSTRINNNSELLKNLQLGSGLTNVLEVGGV